MSRPDLDAIEARAKTATRGPWTACVDGHAPGNRKTIAWIEHSVDELFHIAFGDNANPKVRQDTEFAAHARTDVPALVAYARELEARCARAAELLDRLQWCGDSGGATACPWCGVKRLKDDAVTDEGPTNEHAPDCNLVATIAILKQDAAPPMTQVDALAEAVRRWGTEGGAWYNDGTGVEVGTITRIDGDVIAHDLGAGPTWEAAFADADRMLAAKPSPIHPLKDDVETFLAHAEWLLLTTKQRDEVCALLSKEWENLLDVPAATNEERRSAHAIATARDLLIALSE